jgi:hypothetical protein
MIDQPFLYGVRATVIKEDGKRRDYGRDLNETTA